MWDLPKHTRIIYNVTVKRLSWMKHFRSIIIVSLEITAPGYYPKGRYTVGGFLISSKQIFFVYLYVFNYSTVPP